MPLPRRIHATKIDTILYNLVWFTTNISIIIYLWVIFRENYSTLFTVYGNAGSISYLEDHNQYAKHNNSRLISFNTLSGVSQGTNLEPSNSTWLLFNDDVKQYRAIGNMADNNKFQNNLNEFCQWCKDNKLHNCDVY